MSRTIKKGATDQSVYLEVLDSTSTTGGRKTGLAFNTPGLVAYYVRNQGSAAAITLTTLAAANSAHSDGGFKEVDATNMPGVYRLDLPDAVVATGAESVVVTLKGATGAAQVSSEIQFVDNTEADTYSRIGAPDGASLAADIAAAKAQTAAIETDTQDIQTRLPAALVSGRLDSSVGAMAANVITAAAAAADFKTEVTAGLSTLDAAGVRSAVGLASANLDTQLSGIDSKTTNLPSDPADQSLIIAATDAVMARIGVAGAGLNAVPWNASWNAEVQSKCADALNAYDPPTKAELDAAVASVPGAVWDEATAGHSTAGTTGKALTDAGSAGDPWSTALPGLYGAGTAGKIIGDNINAAIASRATPAQVNSECDAAIADAALATAASLATVIAKTDQMVFTTANQINATTITNSDKTGYVLSAAGSAALSEGYAADGAIATLPQLLYMILSLLSEKSIAGTTLTARKLDGVTTAATFTLNDDAAPTSISRAT